MKTNRILYTILGLSIVIGFSYGQLTPGQAIIQMGRGINIGNTMEPPDGEGTWGNPPLKKQAFLDYKNAGFTVIRIPITWDKHTAATSPYKITKSWLDRVDTVVTWGLKQGLIIIINAHHESWIKNKYSIDTVARFDSIWSQIATRFKDRSDSLLFEIINEPNGLTLSNVNDLNAKTLQIIRKTNPTRIVLFSGHVYSNAEELIQAAILNDNYLIGYYHSYDPYPFGLEGPGTYGSDADIAATAAKFSKVVNWSGTNHVPVFLGEFGYQKKCEYNSRMLAYATVVEKALENNIGFGAWDDGGNWLIYNRTTRGFNEIKDVLIHFYPISPTKLKIAQPKNDSIVLNWTNRTSDNDSIVVERKIDINAEFDTLAVIGPEMNVYADTAVTIGKVYYYRLQTNINDTIFPMSYPISIGLPYFAQHNHDTLVVDTFNLNLIKASDPDISDVITYKISLADGGNMPAWMTLDAKNAILKSNTVTPVAGDYTIILTAKDRSGQVAADTFNFTIEVTSTEVNWISDQNDFDVFPNPANESINIYLASAKRDVEVSIFDLAGRTILMKKIENAGSQTSFSIDLNKIQSGVYVLKLKNINSILCKKIYVSK